MRVYLRWCISFALVVLVWNTTKVCEAGPNLYRISSQQTFSLYKPQLGQSRLQRHIQSGLWSRVATDSKALTPTAGDSSGGIGTPKEAFQAVFWGVGIPLLILDGVLIGGTIHGLFSKKNRYAWGALSTIAGSLTMLWGFFSFSEGTQNAILVGIPMWTVGFVTMTMGILSLAIGRIHAKHSVLPRIKTQRMVATFSPWVSADRDGKPTGGVLVSGTFF